MVFFFPGQGSQFVGMGKELTDKYPIAQEIYQQANDILGMDIQRLSSKGPESDLMNTQYAQPAILIYQYIFLCLLKKKNIHPTATAGHSLGEFSALLASEMLNFEDTLRLVQKRGILMATVDPTHQGTMAVVLGLDDEIVISICSEIATYVEPVNFNTPGQVVISGIKEGVKLAEEKLLSAGAKRVLPLAVSGAFHSKLMNDAAEEFKKIVRGVVFQKPICPIVSNVTGEFYNEESAYELLPLQMKSPVQWVKTVNFLYEKGFTRGFELSSGMIIQGMIKKIQKDFLVDSVLSQID
ncbi:MAG: ACP S-malonyltransferase [Brevinema sp.]